jgi:hypothetical protein
MNRDELLASAEQEIAQQESYINELIDALQDAVSQIEYLHEKFVETGSGNAVIARCRAVVEGPMRSYMP